MNYYLLLLFAMLSVSARSEFFFDRDSGKLSLRKGPLVSVVDKQMLKRKFRTNQKLKKELELFLGDDGSSCLKANNYSIDENDVSLCGLLNNFVYAEELVPKYAEDQTFCLTRSGVGFSTQADRFSSVIKDENCYQLANNRTIPADLYRIMQGDTDYSVSNRFGGGQVQTVRQSRRLILYTDRYEYRKNKVLNACVCEAYMGASRCDNQEADKYYSKFSGCYKLEKCTSSVTKNCSAVGTKSGFDITSIKDSIARTKRAFFQKNPGLSIGDQYNSLIKEYKTNDIDLFEKSTENYFERVDDTLKQAMTKMFDEALDEYIDKHGCATDFNEFLETITQENIKGAHLAAIKSLFDKVDSDTVNSSYENQAMLKFLSLYSQELNKSGLKSAQFNTINRLAPRLQWGYLWKKTVTVQDEQDIDTLVQLTSPSDVKQSLQILKNYMDPEQWKGQKDIFVNMQNPKVIALLEEEYRATVLKELIKGRENKSKIGAIATLALPTAIYVIGKTGTVLYDRNKDKEDSSSLMLGKLGLELERNSKIVQLAVNIGLVGPSVLKTVGKLGLVALGSVGLDSLAGDLSENTKKMTVIDRKLKDALETERKEKVEIERVEKIIEEWMKNLDKQVEDHLSEPSKIFDVVEPPKDPVG